jgi:hypothetical protein
MDRARVGQTDQVIAHVEMTAIAAERGSGRPIGSALALKELVSAVQHPSMTSANATYTWQVGRGRR